MVLQKSHLIEKNAMVKSLAGYLAQIYISYEKKIKETSIAKIQIEKSLKY